LKYEKVIGAAIVGLLLLRTPATITRCVVAIIVSPFELFALRLLSHVGEEVLELEPALADLDAASTVVVIGGLSGVQATPFHG
jgi:hypothetical protein